MLLQDLFAAALRRWPDAPAVDVPPGEGRPRRQGRTYRELDADAAALAARLGPPDGGERVVAVLLPRQGCELYAAKLAILRAGAAWVCLEPHFPDAHLRHVLHDSAAVALVTDAAGTARARALGFAGRIVDAAAALADGRPAAAEWEHPADPHRLAYLIYTSGTTGAPKAVMLEHGGVVNLIREGVRRFGLGPGDRIAQGSSPAYDSSVEETFLALASGATVVLLDDATVRLGPDLPAWLRQERITVLCPPPTLLRSMHVTDVGRELPDLRLCYAGGEAMPQDLCDRWAAALWLENGYGPTECSVTVTRTRLQPGRPVSIGQPVPGNHAHVLDKDLHEIADGEPGELCIAGIGLARGYLGQPELTARQFPTHPVFGRIYRTGDRVVRRPDGDLEYHGRIDAQVKLRGHRLELEAIEAALCRCPGVREAGCRVQGSDGAALLAAHVVPQDPLAPPDAQALQERLRAELPAVMVPARIGVLATLPRTIGGKLDRRALPELGGPATSTAATPAVGIEAAIAKAMAQGLGTTPAPDDDFFALGGDSLRAALVISLLRADPRTAGLTVRDVYGLRTVRALAARAERVVPPAAAAPSPQATPTGQPFWFGLAQTATLLASLVLGGGVLYLLAFALLPFGITTLGPVATILLAPVFGFVGVLGWGLGALWLAVLAKELLVGEYRPGCVPAFTAQHFRCWLVERAVRLVPWSLLAGTELQNMALRALGARIGARVHLHRGVDLQRGGWDLLELHDDVTVGQEAALGVCELDQGQLVFGPVTVRRAATLHVRAGMGPGSEIGEGAELGPLAFLPPGGRVPAHERWDGVPARPTGPAETPPGVDRSDDRLPLRHAMRLLLLRFGLQPLLAVPFALLLLLALHLGGVDTPAALAFLQAPLTAPLAVLLVLASTVLELPARLLAAALLLRWGPKVPAGAFSRWHPCYARLWLRTGLLESAGEWLSGTLFWPAWLRLSGMRIGRRCEISTILETLPEHTALGEECFLADGIYLGVPRLRQGVVTVAPAVLGARTFVGNHAVIEGGQRLPDDLLLGVCTIADDRAMRAGTGWFGLPAFALPRREVVTIDRRLTHEPGLLRRGNRLFWEGLRFLLPVVPALLALLWLQLAGRAEARFAADLGLLLPALGSATLVAALAPCLLVLLLKWLLLGRVRAGQHALWSCWASRWDFLYVCWQRWAAPFLQHLEGTLLLPFYLRAMGMRIGRAVLLGPGFSQVVDPDMLRLADHGTVDTMFQAHSFEDRVLKTAPVHVGRGATLGRASVVLYGAAIGEGAVVGPHGVVMKHERLTAGEHYAGAPTAPAAPTAPPVPVPPAVPTVPAARLPALDAARGLAVLGMVFVHTVPTEGDGWALLPALLARLLEGKPAALFCLLAGIAWAVQRGRGPGPRAVGSQTRRALGLIALGIPFGLLLWPTEVLSPLGLLLLLALPVLGRPASRARGLAPGAWVRAPIAAPHIGDQVEADWHEDGTPAMWSAFGLVTVRYYLFDGNYPVLPWLALPLLGIAMVRAGLDRPARLRRWTWLALAALLPLQLVQATADAALADTAAPLAFTWVPTTLPFLLLATSGAVAVTGGCLLLRTNGRAWAPLTAVGRLSLTHYLLHVALLFPLLRAAWPAEDWPMAVGLAAFLGYTALALAVSGPWLRHCRRGPLEELLARMAGPAR